MSESTRGGAFAVVSVAILTMAAYCCVDIALRSHCESRQPQLERVLGYVLIVLGYLLLPGVGILLVRRQRCLAKSRAVLLLDSDSSDGEIAGGLEERLFGAVGRLFEDGSLARDLDQCSKCVRWEESTDDATQCSVCLMDVEVGNEARVLRCGHAFHKGCADLWLVTGRKNSCPLCMARVCENRDADMILRRKN